MLQAFPQILLGIRQVIHLINSAEPLRQMESGEYTPTRKPVDIYQILDTVKESLAVLSTQNKVGIVLQTTTLDCSPGEPRLCGEAFLIEDMELGDSLLDPIRRMLNRFGLFLNDRDRRRLGPSNSWNGCKQQGDSNSIATHHEVKRIGAHLSSPW